MKEQQDLDINIKNIENELKNILGDEDALNRVFFSSMKYFISYNKIKIKKTERNFLETLSDINNIDGNYYSFFLALTLILSPISIVFKILNHHLNKHLVKYKYSDFIFILRKDIFPTFKKLLYIKDNKEVKTEILNWIDEIHGSKTFNDPTDSSFIKEFDGEPWGDCEYFVYTEKKIKDLEYEDYSKNPDYEIELGSLYLSFRNKYKINSRECELLEDELIEYSDILSDRDMMYKNNEDDTAYFVLSKYIVKPFHEGYSEFLYDKILVINKNIVQLFLNYHLNVYHSNKEMNFINYLETEILPLLVKSKGYNKKTKELSKWILKTKKKYVKEKLENEVEDETDSSIEVLTKVFTYYSNKEIELFNKKYVNNNGKEIKEIIKQYFQNKNKSLNNKRKFIEWNGVADHLYYIIFMLSVNPEKNDKIKVKIVGRRFGARIFKNKNGKNFEESEFRRGIDKYKQFYKDKIEDELPKAVLKHKKILNEIL